jgi:hypothetical protein
MKGASPMLLEKKPNHLKAYVKKYCRDQGIDTSSAVSDILADLLHICREENIILEDRLTMAYNHYWEERRNLIFGLPKDKLPILFGDDTLEDLEREALTERMKG